MQMTTRWRSLALGVVAATMLISAPAAAAHEEHPGQPAGGPHPEFPFAKLCHRAANSPRLTAEQRAAVAAACAQLKGDLRAAKAKLAAAIATARTSVQQAQNAALAACGEGQFNSEACRNARAAAEQAKHEAVQNVNAANRQFVQDVQAAVNAFKAALRPIKQSLEGGHAGPGKNGPRPGAH